MRFLIVRLTSINRLSKNSHQAFKKAEQPVAINTTLAIPTNFGLRIEGDIVWDESDKWKFAAQKTPFVVNPGATLKILIKAEATYPNIYPVPKITVHFRKLIGTKEGFRNDKLTFDAIKEWPLYNSYIFRQLMSSTCSLAAEMTDLFNSHS